MDSEQIVKLLIAHRLRLRLSAVGLVEAFNASSQLPK